MQVVLSLAPGGTERLVIEIARRLAPSVRSTICCLDRCGEWAGELLDAGVPVVALERDPGFQPRLGYQIARLAERHGVDVLHCHHYTPFVYGQLAGLLRPRLRVIFTEHGRLSDAPPSAKRRLVNPLLGRLPAAVFAVSTNLRLHMIAEGLPADRVRVVHNGIEPGPRPTLADRAEARRALGLPADALVVGTIGRLDPVKQLDSLVDAFALVRRTHPRACLVVVGDGPERATVEQRVDAHGLREAVCLAGYRRDARALLPAFDLYANSSMYEGVSLTLLEAMAAAMPIVATRVGGTPEVVVDGETGLLVPARAPGRLASAIDRLMTAHPLRRRMGDAARFRVKRHFSVEGMAASYLRAYRGEAEE